MSTTFNSFQQACVRDLHYPNQGNGSTLGRSMCLAGMSTSLGELSESFRLLVENSEIRHSDFRSRQGFINGRKLETVESLRNLLGWLACYANEWGFELEDVVTGKAEQPGTVAGYLEGDAIDR